MRRSCRLNRVWRPPETLLSTRYTASNFYKRKQKGDDDNKEYKKLEKFTLLVLSVSAKFCTPLSVH